MIQDFYVEQLRKEVPFRHFDPSRARFQSYLSSAVERFCTRKLRALLSKIARETDFNNESDRSEAVVSERDLAAERHRDWNWALSRALTRTPEREFHRNCAWSLVRASFDQLHAILVARRDWEAIHSLLPFLIGPEPDYAEVASELGCAANCCRQRVRRLRLQWEKVFRDIVAGTLDLSKVRGRLAREATINREVEDLLAAMFPDD